MGIFDPQFPHRFALFAPSHIVAMLVVLVIWVAVPFAMRRWRSDRADRLLRYGLAVILLTQSTGWMLWEALTGSFTVHLSLPLNLCDLSNLLCCVLLVTRSYALYEVLYFWVLAGTLQSFVTPNIVFAFPHYEFLAFYTQHGGEVLGILYLTLVAGLRPRPVSMAKAFGLLLAFVGVVYLFNLLSGSNYMFLMADTPHESTVSKMIRLFGQPPRHLLGLGLVAAVSVLVLYSPFLVHDMRAKSRRLHAVPEAQESAAV